MLMVSLDGKIAVNITSIEERLFKNMYSVFCHAKQEYIAITIVIMISYRENIGKYTFTKREIHIVVYVVAIY